MKIDKSKLDVSAVFLTYMATVGCPERTGLAMNLDPALVAQLAKDEGWDLKLKRISVLSKSEKPGDFYRAQNRCINWVMAHQLRTLLSKVLDSFKADSPDEIVERLSTRGKDGGIHLSARFFSDLASAMEKAQFLSYRALGDTAEGTDEGDKVLSVNDLHATVIAALNGSGLVAGVEKSLMDNTLEAVVLGQTERKSLPESGEKVGDSQE